MTKIQTRPELSETDRIHAIMPQAIPMRSTTTNRVMKLRKTLSPSEARQRKLDREEMHSLLAKLKQLVPSIPKNRKMSKLQIIQHVIDYIFDLQMALESHPISATAAAEFMSNTLSTFSAPSTSMSTMALVAALSSTVVSDDDLSVNASPCDPMPYQCPNTTHTPQRIPGTNRQPLASIML